MTLLAETGAAPVTAWAAGPPRPPGGSRDVAVPARGVPAGVSGRQGSVPGARRPPSSIGPGPLSLEAAPGRRSRRSVGLRAGYARAPGHRRRSRLPDHPGETGIPSRPWVSVTRTPTRRPWSDPRGPIRRSRGGLTRAKRGGQRRDPAREKFRPRTVREHPHSGPSTPTSCGSAAPGPSRRTTPTPSSRP
jgi:hypothetical protein